MQIVKVQQPDTIWTKAKKLSDIYGQKKYYEDMYKYNTGYMNPTVTDNDIAEFQKNPDWQNKILSTNPELAKLTRTEENANHYDALQKKTLTDYLINDKRNKFAQNFVSENKPFNLSMLDYLRAFL